MMCVVSHCSFDPGSSVGVPTLGRFRASSNFESEISPSSCVFCKNLADFQKKCRNNMWLIVASRNTHATGFVLAFADSKRLNLNRFEDQDVTRPRGKAGRHDSLGSAAHGVARSAD